MNAKDRLQKLTGKVSLVLTHRITGERKVVESNLVTRRMYVSLAHLLGNDNPENYKAHRIGVGTGSATPTLNDTTITFLSPTVWLYVTPSYPTIDKVVLTGEWDWDEERVENLTELGLFNVQGDLIARVVFPAMRKSALWKWTIEWVLDYGLQY